MTKGVDVIEMSLPARPEYVGVVRLTVSGLANRAGMAYDDIEDVKLAVAEACTNVVQHAYGADEVGSIHLRCKIMGDRMVIEVADDGQSFPVDAVPAKLKPIDHTLSVDELTEGGLGLYLIHTLMDEVQISGEHGVMISMTKYLRQDGVAEHGGAAN
ncbi:anti-sigma B factor RsbW [Brevibacillus migulae]|uniref:anti-sigma B factor RsbW n=1 Tax=Brevibacillus migulae TaxID=1644114 RepID=UPI00106EC016|nr:anti-sigma B factor RsbW [Brevibacillus migulae]